MGLTLITPASSYPVTVAEVKRAAGLLDTTFDDLLEDYIPAAVQMVEEHIGRSISQQTWELTLDAFSDTIELSRGPVVSVTAFSYVDEGGFSLPVDPDLYTLDLVSSPQWIVLNSGSSWPDTIDAVNCVKVRYLAGYASDVPPVLRGVICSLVVQWFESRMVGVLPDPLRAALSPFRRIMI